MTSNYVDYTRGVNANVHLLNSLTDEDDVDRATDVERFSYWSELMEEKFLEEPPQLVFKGKDTAKSEAARRSGNKSIATDLTAALKAYNEAIVHAPWKSNSETAGSPFVLALGNRSVVFFRTGRYYECVRDIDQALVLGFPRNSTKKLLLRKASALLAMGRNKEALVCLKREAALLKILDESAISKDEEYSRLVTEAAKPVGAAAKVDIAPKCPDAMVASKRAERFSLKNGANPLHPAVSSSLKIEAARNRWIAKEEVDAGDVLFIERPTASVLLKDCLLTNCYSCHMWTDSPFPCKECSVVIFCSPGCATGEKATIHARECSYWYTFYENASRELAMGSSVPALVAMRAILSKPASEWKKWASGVTRKNPIHTRLLLPQQIVQRKEIEYRAAFIACFVVHVLVKRFFNNSPLSQTEKEFVGAVVARAVTNVMFRGMAASEADCCGTSLVASATYTSAQLIDQGCYTNLIITFDGDVSVVRALRPIKKGEPLMRVFHSNHLESPIHERKLSLHTVRFVCECLACVEKWPTEDELVTAFKNQGPDSLTVACRSCGRTLGKRGTIASKRYGCSGCKKSPQEALNPMLEQVKRAWDLVTTPMDDPLNENVEDIFCRINEINRVVRYPSWSSYALEERARRVCLRRANRCFE